MFRSSLPERSGCRKRAGRRISRGRTSARATFLDVDAIVDAVARDARDGDLVVVMSNGGFGGIHQKLSALAARS